MITFLMQRMIQGTVSVDNNFTTHPADFTEYAKNKRDKNQIHTLQMGLVLLMTPLLLYFDSTLFSQNCAYGQWIADACMGIFFAWFYWMGDRKLRFRMLSMVLISSLAEIWLSLGIKLYIYRLENVPIYVPLGHAIVFSTVYYVQRQAIIRRHNKRLIPTLLGLITLVSSGSLILFHDVFGFTCFILFLIFLSTKRSKMFYLCMFMMVLYLELCGTRLQNWAWYGVIGNHLDYLTTANPPVGIAGLYMILDMLTNNSYFWLSRYRKQNE